MIRRERERERSCLLLLLLWFSRLYNVEKRSTGRPRESIVFSTHSDRYRVPLLSRANLDIRVYICTRIHAMHHIYIYSASVVSFLYIRYKYAGYRCTTLHDLVNTLNEWFSRWMARHHGAAANGHTPMRYNENTSRSKRFVKRESWRAS